ncbi:hypothetical protein QBC35DRAFT_479981 [Podospora australis]|uniref:Coupling of ubiquitin conjugation to ER degradation protein 1 n=1 Tax=Podospora australis TaxID=1536484 RepID=A0AAN7AM14_9PEZI|nr:hypothetical protein QBC35DRAFT_479981 [Podospora australis]
MADEQQQINVPSLVVILVISGLILRYFFLKPSGGGSAAAAAGARRAGARDPAALARSREAAVERIQQMFPQVERRTILWDLQRTGGNIAATTERILAGRLETPPISFQPPPPPGSSNSNSNGRQTPAAKPAEVPAQPDLITRYNLKDKINTAVEEGTAAKDSSANGKSTGKSWSTNKDERQSLLQKRRDQMILEARRKMEAKIAAEKAAAGAGKS